MTRARILVADDHKRMRDEVVRLLNREFHVLESVGDGEALLLAEARLKPDVCVVDISMPIMNGLDAAAELKHTGAASKIVFLTIHDDADFVSAALRTGAEGYVIKTRMTTDLPVAVREVLAGRTFVSELDSTRTFRRNDVDGS